MGPLKSELGARRAGKLWLESDHGCILRTGRCCTLFRATSCLVLCGNMQSHKHIRYLSQISILEFMFISKCPVFLVELHTHPFETLVVMFLCCIKTAHQCRHSALLSSIFCSARNGHPFASHQNHHEQDPAAPNAVQSIT